MHGSLLSLSFYFFNVNIIDFKLPVLLLFSSNIVIFIFYWHVLSHLHRKYIFGSACVGFIPYGKIMQKFVWIFIQLSLNVRVTVDLLSNGSADRGLLFLKLRAYTSALRTCTAYQCPRGL